MSKLFDKQSLKVSEKRRRKGPKIDVQKYSISEKELKDNLKNEKRILLIEPEYKRKIIPMGLAKISAFAKKKKAQVHYHRNPYQSKEKKFDRIYISSMFTYDSAKVLETINKTKHAFPGIPITIGGIYASLMPEHILEKTKSDINLFIGTANFLDETPMDYSLDYKLEKPWDDFSFVFTTRGCSNKCAYCAVWRIEPQLKIIKNWKKQIDLSKSNIMMSDNNLSMQPMEHIKKVIKFVTDKNKSLLLDNGLDCKHITKEMADIFSEVRFVRQGMRVAFDRIEEDGVFQKAVEILISKGIPKYQIMAYVLFNFNDKPKDAEYRARECLRLGIRPYPQKFMPLNSTNRENPFVGKHWTHNLARAFRYFWLMGSLHRKMSFEEYIKSENQFKITENDIAVYSK